MYNKYKIILIFVTTLFISTLVVAGADNIIYIGGMTEGEERIIEGLPEALEVSDFINVPDGLELDIIKPGVLRIKALEDKFNIDLKYKLEEI